MKELFSKVVSCASFGRYRLVASAAEATEVGQCWVEKDQAGNPRLFVVEKVVRDDKGRLHVDAVLIEPGDNSRLWTLIVILLAVGLALAVTRMA